MFRALCMNNNDAGDNNNPTLPFYISNFFYLMNKNTTNYIILFFLVCLYILLWTTSSALFLIIPISDFGGLLLVSAVSAYVSNAMRPLLLIPLTYGYGNCIHVKPKKMSSEESVLHTC